MNNYETVELSLEEAVKLEAKQNKERDMRVMGEEDLDADDIYEEEARHLLTTLGEGYLPEYPDHKFVKLAK
ncbi:hypothetical protein [Acinetobacter sp.]|uniref:hypothetical protein n=1 Tax=Acinetobacter sp. TaxID=472 RepID=UPI00388F698E